MTTPPITDQDAAERMLAHVVESLQHPSPQVRLRAVETLGSIGKAEHIALLMPYIDPAHELPLRLAAITAAARLGGKGAQPLLERLLNDSQPSVRWTVDSLLTRLLTNEQTVAPNPKVVDEGDEDPLVIPF
jgi:HEAT repeat protein